MARPAGSEQASGDVDSINLSRALARLQQKILSSEPDPRLLHSGYERTKTAANLEYARTLLLRLERATMSVKVQSRKQAAQAQLAKQRSLIRRLNDRLRELGQLDDGTYSDSSDDEDVLGPDPRSDIKTSIRSMDQQQPPPSPMKATPSPQLSSTLRARNIPTAQGSIESSSSTTTAHSLGAKGSGKGSTSDKEGPSTTVAKRLEADASIHTSLTSELVAMAAALKAQSQKFAADLAADSGILTNTEASLDKNQDGLAGATQRMSVLTRMSEGRWWWGRMLLYIAIAGLWLLALLLVFVAPKLRF